MSSLLQKAPQLPKSERDFREILQRIHPFILKTPVLSGSYFDEECDTQLFFKCENFQKIGAFKARGALNALLRLTPEQLKNGVATHSSGNHAQALAYAAKVVGTKALIVMPSNSAKVKTQGVQRLGGEIIWCEPNTQDRESKLNAVVKQTGAYFVPPYNHEWIIGGQGTAAIELMDEVQDLDILVAPTGGGGLLSGTALAAAMVNPQIVVYGAEPEALNDAARSFESGKIETNPPEAFTIADGLRTSLGELTLGCILKHVKQILTVTEGEIILAMQTIWERLKITAEPSSAVALAAVLKNKGLFSGKRVGIIISGGNVDLSDLPF